MCDVEINFYGLRVWPEMFTLAHNYFNTVISDINVATEQRSVSGISEKLEGIVLSPFTHKS